MLLAAISAASVSSCNDNEFPLSSKSSETVVITAVVSEETTETSEEPDETSSDMALHDGEAIDLIMYAVKDGVVKDDPSLRGEVIADYTTGAQFHVIGTVRHYYAVELPDGSIGYVMIAKLSEEDPGVTGEITPVETTQETEETEETSEASEASSEPASQPASDSGDAPSSEPDQPSGGPDLGVTYNGNSIGSYEVDGYGTVYGYFVDSSYFNSLVNDHRSEIGIPEWNFTSSDATRTRAVECTVVFDHTRPNGLSSLSLFDYSGGEIICSSTDNAQAFDLFMGSDGHRGIIEDSEYSFSNACSAAFVRVDWADGSWQYNSSSLVCNCW